MREIIKPFTRRIKQSFGMNTVLKKPSLAYPSDMKDMVIYEGLMSTRGGFGKDNQTAFAGAILGIFDYRRKNGRRGFLYCVKSSEGDGRIYRVLRPDFLAFPIWGEKDLAVYFVDTTWDVDSEIDSYAWEFGDGGTSTEQDSVHTYTTTGIFTVTLTVSDGTFSYNKVKHDYILVYDSSIPYDDYTSIPYSGYNPNPDFYPGYKENIDYLDVTAVDPATMEEGEDPELTITGAQFFGHRIEYVILADTSYGTYKFLSANVVVSSKTSITAEIAEGNDLTEGTYDVIVLNEDGKYGILEEGFEVTEVVVANPMVWRKTGVGGYSCEYATFDASGVLGSTSSIISVKPNGQDPHCEWDEDGNVQVLMIWTDTYNKIYHKVVDVNGDEVVTEHLFYGPTANIGLVDFCRDALGNFQVFSRSGFYDLIWHKMNKSGVILSGPLNPASGSSSTFYWTGFSAVSDEDGNIHLITVQEDLTSPYDFNLISYKFDSDGAIISGPSTLETVTPDDWLVAPGIARDADGNLHVVYEKYIDATGTSELRWRKINKSGTLLSGPTVLDTSTVIAFDNLSIGLDSDDNLYIVSYTFESGANRFKYHKIDSSGAIVTDRTELHSNLIGHPNTAKRYS